MIAIAAGRMRALPGFLIRAVKKKYEETDGDLYVVVPKQLTLDTENLLMEGLGLEGSFRIRVLSPDRLCRAIFTETGFPGGTRLDERGRAMLTHRLLRRCSNRLTIYAKSWKKRGFAERAAGELELLEQSGLSSEDLWDASQRHTGALSRKLGDLSVLLREYREACEGMYLDGAREYEEAIHRVGESSFVNSSGVWFYGFESTPPTLTRLMARMGRLIRDVTVLFAADADDGIPDRSVFVPMRRTMERLREEAVRAGADVKMLLIPFEGAGRFSHTERYLFADRPPEPRQAPEGLHAYSFADVYDEARFTAAQVRRLAKEKGLHWRDFAVLLQDAEGTAPALEAAFRAAGIPLTISDTRPASANALAAHLLTALELAAGSWKGDAVREYALAGFTGLTKDETELFANEAAVRRLGGRYFAQGKKPRDEADARFEELREKVASPLLRLKASLTGAPDLPAQLTAIFGFLGETDSFAQSEKACEELTRAGEVQHANELRQVWNRIMGALDQLYALMGTERLPMAELARLIRDSLDATELKTLPASCDAVLAQPLGRPVSGARRAVFLLGMCDTPSRGADLLMTQDQHIAVARETGAYLGPEKEEEPLMRRFHVKCAAGLAQDELVFSYAMAGADGSVRHSGPAFLSLKQLYGDSLTVVNGSRDGECLRTVLSVPGEAALFLARASRERLPVPYEHYAALLPDGGAGLERILRGNLLPVRESLSREHVLKLYRELKTLSVSRLELFASCPFPYFLQYGIRPEEIREDAFDVQDEGTFLHECVSRFTQEHRSRLSDMGEDEAKGAMLPIAREEISRFLRAPDDPLESARAEHLMENALNAAGMIAYHMRGSSFSVDRVESDFGPGRQGEALTVGGVCTLNGRIDRIDTWLSGDSAQYLRVVDYKRSGKALDLSGVYYGTQLQLLVYLASALGGTKIGSAGVYYFKLGDGILTTDERNESKAREKRLKDYGMQGLAPDDPELIKAMTGDRPQVVGASFKSDGSLSRTHVYASEADYRRLMRKALEKAGEHLDGILSGCADVSPIKGERRTTSQDDAYDREDACRYCPYRSACLYDGSCSRSERVLPSMSAKDVLEALVREEADLARDGGE